MGKSSCFFLTHGVDQTAVVYQGDRLKNGLIASGLSTSRSLEVMELTQSINQSIFVYFRHDKTQANRI